MGLGSNGDSGQPLAEINVTPFVDILLVLLVIFMVTAPLAHTGITVELPKSKSGKVKSEEQKIIVTITKKKSIFINKVKFTLKDLNKKLTSIYKDRGDRSLYIRADKSVKYEMVINVIDIAKSAGVLKIGMVTTRKRKRR